MYCRGASLTVANEPLDLIRIHCGEYLDKLLEVSMVTLRIACIEKQPYLRTSSSIQAQERIYSVSGDAYAA